MPYHFGLPGNDALGLLGNRRLPSLPPLICETAAFEVCETPRHHPHVFWLHVEFKTQLDRLKNDKTRPLLQVTDPKAKLRAMAIEREPLYREYSSIQVQTRRTNPSVVVRQIMERIERQIDENA